MRLFKTLGFAGALVAAALVGGTLIGSAFAVEDGTQTDAARGEYCDVFMDALASELGTDRDGLVTAGRAAANAAVDAALEAGDMSEERAAAVRERIAAHDGEGCGLFGKGFGRGFHHGMARGFLGGNVFEAAADALGLESSQLIGQVRDTGSLEALATEQGAAYDDVRASILAEVQADLDAAVAEGMSQERADAVIERLTTWLDEGGQLDGLRGHHGPGGRGHWGGDDADAEESGT